MHDLPAPRPGFARLAVLCTRTRPQGPGEVARATGLDPDDIGPVSVVDDQVLIDIRRDHGLAVRERLARYGPVQLADLGREPAPRWAWVRLAIGRNHGLTISQLRKLLERAGVGQPGRIHINNTHTAVGLREDVIDATIAWFAAHRVNGSATRPVRPPPGTIKGDPAFGGPNGR